MAEPVLAVQPEAAAGEAPFNSAAFGSTVPPWSAAHAYTNLFGPKSPTTATVVGNVNCTEAGFDSQTHHIVLDFGADAVPGARGPVDRHRPARASMRTAGRTSPRQYSVASPRNGERPGYNNVSLTVKRVTEDHQGRPVRGVASNYVCDLKVGDTVQVIGPFGQSFLMPNHPKSHIVMICTGTGSAPMRAMTEWRRRLRKSGKFEGGKLMLFFGARTPRGAAVLRAAADAAQGLHRHQPRVLAHARPAEALRAGPDARARGRPRPRCSPTRTRTSTSAA